MNVSAVSASPENLPFLLEDGAFIYILEKCSISFLVPFFDTGYKIEGPGDLKDALIPGDA